MIAVRKDADKGPERPDRCQEVRGGAKRREETRRHAKTREAAVLLAGWRPRDGVIGDPKSSGGIGPGRQARDSRGVRDCNGPGKSTDRKRIQALSRSRKRFCRHSPKTEPRKQGLVLLDLRVGGGEQAIAIEH